MLQSAEQSHAHHTAERAKLQATADQAAAALVENEALLQKRTREIADAKTKLATLAAQQSMPSAAATPYGCSVRGLAHQLCRPLCAAKRGQLGQLG